MKVTASHFVFHLEYDPKSKQHGGIAVGTVVNGKSYNGNKVFLVGFSFVDPSEKFNQKCRKQSIRISLDYALSNMGITMVEGASTGKRLDHVRLGFDSAFDETLRPSYFKGVSLCSGIGFVVQKAGSEKIDLPVGA